MSQVPHGSGPGSPELPHSRLYTFLDESRTFALYFLEGQRLIHDLALLHCLQRGGFAYFRDVVLSIQPMIALLKHGEQFGFYIDSEAPFFRLKIETGHHGAMRSMLMPEELEEFPEQMTGIVRLQKLFPRNRPPYQSVLEIHSGPLREIVNRVLEDSYQVRCEIVVSETSDQSLMLHQLPPLPGKEDYEYSPRALRERRRELQAAIGELFGSALTDPAEIDDAFREIGFRRLAERPVQFRCSCSQERMVQNVYTIWLQEGDGLFDPGKDDLEAVCEYCKSAYQISRDELRRSPIPMN